MGLLSSPAPSFAKCGPAKAALEKDPELAQIAFDLDHWSGTSPEGVREVKKYIRANFSELKLSPDFKLRPEIFGKRDDQSVPMIDVQDGEKHYLLSLGCRRYQEVVPERANPLLKSSWKGADLRAKAPWA